MTLLDKMRRQNAQMLAAAADDFSLYCIAVYRGYQLAPHLKMLIEKLTAVEAGTVDRLCVSAPPRHGKSLTVSCLFVCWTMGRHPEQSVALATYNEQIAQELGRMIARVMKGAAHRAIFPEAALSTEVGSSENIELQASGHVYIVSRNGTLTGRGVRILIIDDLLKDAAEAGSPTIRKSNQEWYEKVGLTRLTPDGAVIQVATRWHESDLAGYLLSQESEKPWLVLNFTAIALENDVLGREVGAALWPGKFDLKYLARRRAEMGARAFVSLYQGSPSEAQGNIFRRTEWRYYTTLPAFKRIIASTDTAFKVTSSADFSTRQVWGEAANGYYLLNAHRARLAYPDLRRGLIADAELWKPEVILIEDAASGQSLLQELRETTSLPLKAIRPDRDKISRAESVTPLLEAGRVFLPQDAPWLNDFLDELSSFPNGAHDDQVDACTQALNYLRGQSGGFGLIELLKTGWDGFCSTFERAPRTNPEKTAAFEVEKKIRGLVSSAPDGSAWKPKAGPCPACKATCTVYLNGAMHCNSCRADFTDDGEVTLHPAVCCATPILQPFSSGMRCQNCGWQSPIPVATAAEGQRAGWLRTH